MIPQASILLIIIRHKVAYDLNSFKSIPFNVRIAKKKLHRNQGILQFSFHEIKEINDIFYNPHRQLDHPSPRPLCRPQPEADLPPLLLHVYPPGWRWAVGRVTTHHPCYHSVHAQSHAMPARMPNFRFVANRHRRLHPQ